jgi:hypothetical protein
VLITLLRQKRATQRQNSALGIDSPTFTLANPICCDPVHEAESAKPKAVAALMRFGDTGHLQSCTRRILPCNAEAARRGSRAFSRLSILGWRVYISKGMSRLG